MSAPWLPPHGDHRIAEWAAYHHGLAYRALTTPFECRVERGRDGGRRRPPPLFVPAWLDTWYARTAEALYDIFLDGREGCRWPLAGAGWKPLCTYEVDGIQVAWGDTPEQAEAMFRWFQQGGRLGGEGR